MLRNKRRISISVDSQTFDLLSSISKNSGIPVSELVSSFVNGINPFLFAFDRSLSDIALLRSNLSVRVSSLSNTTV